MGKKKVCDIRYKESFYPVNTKYPQFWFYKDKHNICFVHEVRWDKKYIRTDMFSIPLWKFGKRIKEIV